MSRSMIAPLLATSALTLPLLAHGSTVTLSTTLKNYGGNGAYLAIYLADPKGAYAGTLWVAGGKAKYYRHLAAWNRLSAGDGRRLDGVTGASVGEGRTLKVTADLADALIDAGYEIRIDVAVEDMRDSPAEIRVPLARAEAGKAQAGRQYVRSFSYQIE